MLNKGALNIHQCQLKSKQRSKMKKSITFIEQANQLKTKTNLFVLIAMYLRAEGVCVNMHLGIITFDCHLYLAMQTMRIAICKTMKHRGSALFTFHSIKLVDTAHSTCLWFSVSVYATARGWSNT